MISFKKKIQHIQKKVSNISSFIVYLWTIKHNCGGWILFLAKTYVILRIEGFSGLVSRIKRYYDFASKSHKEYSDWIVQYDLWTPQVENEIRKRAENLQNKPIISIVMPVFDPEPNMLIEAIESVLHQVYSNWELCISDDASTNQKIHKILRFYQKIDQRIKVIFRVSNGHISKASNDAIALAEGEYIALLDHDDLLAPDALYWTAEAICRNPQAAIIYTDEDKIDTCGNRSEPYFKSDWNYDLMLSQNMINHLGVYKKELVDQVGGFRIGFEGSQDYDLALRIIERVSDDEIVHIPRVLYHWRQHEQSTSKSMDAKTYALDAARKTIQEHLERMNIRAFVDFHPELPYCCVRYHLPEILPLVSLIIPTRNNHKYLKKCISSILNLTSYQNYEIIIVDNGSDSSDTLSYFSELRDISMIKILHDPRPFNYSALNNRAAGNARGSIIGLLNDDVEVLSSNWLSEMVGIALQPGVGAVGARLLYPNSKDGLQHGGVILGLGGIAGHSHRHCIIHDHGYFGRAKLIQSFSAVTGACLIVEKSTFEHVKGLDEKITVSFNDVDFCLRIRSLGLRIVWTPFAELIHHESMSRGIENTPAKKKRFEYETASMLLKWGDQLANDPAYNPNLALNTEKFDIAWPPRMEFRASIGSKNKYAQ